MAGPPSEEKRTFVYSKEQEDIYNRLRQYPVKIRGDPMEIPAPPPSPPPRVNLNPWPIKQTLTDYEVDGLRIKFSLNDTFQHVISHWSLEAARILTDDRKKVAVTLWDLTEAESPRRHYRNGIHLEIMWTGESILWCKKLYECRKLKIGDEVHLAWDSRKNSFNFRSVPRITP